MYEKVNPKHPDKVADRIAGAIVDLAYKQKSQPRIAVEVLLGHGACYIIAESSTPIPIKEVREAVKRISGQNVSVTFYCYPQDHHLSDNQQDGYRCGDNGIFKGVPVTEEQKELSKIARALYEKYDSDGKYIKDGDKLIICQSNASTEEIRTDYPKAEINPLGDWTGGINVDAGATNRKLGSDMGDAVTGGGLHGKDLSKADVSVNIYAHLKAQEKNQPVMISCAIGDDTVDGRPYSEIVEIAREYINSVGGFEAFAFWGLI